MNAKDLERTMASHGARASGVAVVVQNLREGLKGRKVSVGGRGFNAHDLTPDEMAWIVATYVGSEVPARARETLVRLLKLRAPVDSTGARSPAEFILSLSLILRRDINGVREIRIGRNADFAQIIFDDGTVRTFANWRAPTAALPLFRSEGVISGGLIDLLADSVVLESNKGMAGDAIEYEGPADV